MTPLLKIHGIHRAYADVPVLKGVSLDVYPGETIAIIGRSGCGKSTLLKCLSCLEDSDSGDAELEGQKFLVGGKPACMPWEIRSNIIMVFQEYNLFPNMTGLRNITLALEKVRGMTRAEAEKLANETAARLGIEQTLNRYPNELSGGQAQRLALARAMVLQPRVLLLDEITAALDPETILNVVEAIRHVRAADKRGDMAIILVTHLMRFAAEFADRVAFLHEGRIWEDLPAKEFFEKCKLPETRKFISTSLIPV